MALNPSLKYMPKYSGSDYELKVSRVKMDDHGEYIVRAVNSFGSKEESAALSVERKLHDPSTLSRSPLLCTAAVVAPRLHLDQSSLSLSSKRLLFKIPSRIAQDHTASLHCSLYKYRDLELNVPTVAYIKA